MREREREFCCCCFHFNLKYVLIYRQYLRPVKHTITLGVVYSMYEYTNVSICGCVYVYGYLCMCVCMYSRSTLAHCQYKFQ